MTFCIGVKLKSGLLAMADTRITSEVGVRTAKKISFVSHEAGKLFLMTSGLRSVRDKAVIYFEEKMREDKVHPDKMHNAANLLGQQIKRAAHEDREDLVKAGYHFNIHAIIGGQLKGDESPRLFLIYPEGNWVEVTDESPFAIIGNSKFGIPILKRVLQPETDWREALKLMFISFDATVQNAPDVEFPLDVVYYEKDSYHMSERRFERTDLAELSDSYLEGLKKLVENLPLPYSQKGPFDGANDDSGLRREQPNEGQPR